MAAVDPEPVPVDPEAVVPVPVPFDVDPFDVVLAVLVEDPDWAAWHDEPPPLLCADPDPLALCVPPALVVDPELFAVDPEAAVPEPPLVLDVWVYVPSDVSPLELDAVDDDDEAEFPGVPVD